MQQFIAYFARTYGLYILVALAVMLPLLAPGFILTLDMVFTPELRLPDEITSSYPLYAALHFLNFIVPAEILQKLLLLSILPLASIGMHRLIRLLQPTAKKLENDWSIFAASVFFAINPFTYSRFMAGQYAVLLGYALLPWFVRLLLRFLHRPNAANGLRLGGLAALIAMLSIHTVAAIIILSLAGAGLAFWRYRQKIGAYARYGLIGIGLFAVLSSYWLVPLALGQGKTADTINSFTTADSTAFATRGGNELGRLGNVVRLQGFWAEDKALFLLPQDHTFLWGTMALIILTLVVTGFVVLWHRSRPLAVFFTVSGLAAIVLVVGLPGSWDDRLLLVIGIREPHKLIALLALSYGVGLAFGGQALLQWARGKAETTYSILAISLLLLPFAFMQIMFWGFQNQLKPRHYPADWFSANQRLNQDAGTFDTLFLPWHQYMSFDFTGRIIATPAPSFFDKPIVSSTDPELDGASGGPQDDHQTALNQILAQAKDRQDLGERIASQNIKYIILAKDLDYRDYDYLNRQTDVTEIADYQEIKVYKNNAWRSP